MISKRATLFFISFLILDLLTGCATKPCERISTPLVPVKPSRCPFLADDLGAEHLELAVVRSLKYYERLPETTVYSFGKDRYSVRELKESLLEFLEILTTSDSDEERDKKIKKTFNVYKSIGRGDKGRVFFTGYYEPVLNGSLEKNSRYSYPIYRIPDDHITIDLGNFREKYRGERIIARIEKGNIVPYYTREDIDVSDCLKDRGLEIAWVDDLVDLFFLHIQGSGMIRLPDGVSIQVSYAHKNGHLYSSIGRLLVDRGKMSLDESSLESIKSYLGKHPEEMMDILAHNKSYVFFRIVDKGPVGSLNVPVTSRRSIATDSSLFPKGALAFIKTKKPVIDEDGTIERWISFSRFVLNQDTGGAIKGPGRVDLFCGRGKEAEIMAGNLKKEGELYFLVKKKE